MEDYKIDAGVPLPKRKPTVRLSKMKLNESIAFPEAQRASVQSTASRLKKDKAMWFTIQKMPDGVCRVWRIQ